MERPVKSIIDPTGDSSLIFDVVGVVRVESEGEPKFL